MSKTAVVGELGIAGVLFYLAREWNDPVIQYSFVIAGLILLLLPALIQARREIIEMEIEAQEKLRG
ncbi:MAG: hypothetical protein ACXQTL_04820 [Methanosarcinales archaeon]